MTLEQVLFILESIKLAIGANIDLFLINTSVFFFANTYMQSRQSWENNLKKTTTAPLKWNVMVSFKENPLTPVTDENMRLHPEWTIIFPSSTKKEITVSEYADYLAYDKYDEAYEVKYAGEKKDRYAAFYGAVLLILGSFVSLQKNCGNVIVAASVLLIYIVMAIIVIKAFSYGIEPMTKVRPCPSRPSFLDE